MNCFVNESNPGSAIVKDRCKKYSELGTSWSTNVWNLRRWFTHGIWEIHSILAHWFWTLVPVSLWKIGVLVVPCVAKAFEKEKSNARSSWSSPKPWQHCPITNVLDPSPWRPKFASPAFATLWTNQKRCRPQQVQLSQRIHPRTSKVIISKRSNIPFRR